MITPKTPQQKALLGFFDLVVWGKIKEGYDTHIHPDFRHHNLWYKGDRDSLMKGMEENHKKFPAKKFDVKKILEDGDTVMTLSNIAMDGMNANISVVHIARFKDGKIIEMWDTGQEIPKDSPNENGAF